MAAALLHLPQPRLLPLLEVVLVVALFLLQYPTVISAGDGTVDGSFVFNGFPAANVSVDGAATVAPDGLLTLTNATKGQTGHAFLPAPLRFRRRRSPGGGGGGRVLSFATTFVFAIVPVSPEVASYGMAVVVAPTRDLPRDPPGPFMGLFNSTTNGSAANRLLAVEFDTTVHAQYRDIDDNHVGIDVNSVTSNASATAAYYGDRGGGGGGKENLTLASGDPMQAWVVYDGGATRLDVTIAPLGRPRPATPLLSSPLDLSELFLDAMFVGFSASTGKALTSHYVLGWSFAVGDPNAPELDLSRLPPLPRKGSSSTKTNPLAIWLPTVLSASILAAAAAGVFAVVRKAKFAEVREDWELEYGPHRFSYRDLYRATKGFRESELLGVGGSGEVYRGVLPASKIEVAVKRVVAGGDRSTQGEAVREFVAEIATLGRLRHRNLVQLLGYSRRRGGLFLVYDYMPNGSLDKLLFDPKAPALSWARRFRIVRGVAAALLYLHEEWEQVVLHRDVKASNVLLDADFEARLGDFGLSRLYDHGAGPQTTHVVGTTGYMPPELARTGKATKAGDVYAYGAFLLEVACGRRPVGDAADGDRRAPLVSRVLECWGDGDVVKAADPRLRGEWEEKEVELVLMVGLHCCNPSPAARPSMRQVVQILGGGDAALPELSPEVMASAGHGGGSWGRHQVFDGVTSTASYASSRFTDSVLSGGR